MAAVVMFLALFLAVKLSAVSATDQCSSSADVSMSGGFLPAALSALAPLGYGSCDGYNATCSTPPAVCPSSSCCISPSDPNGGTCGCLTTSAGGTQTCSDPRILAIDLLACNADGNVSDTNIQISILPRGTKCEESVEVKQVVSSDGSTKISVVATTCFRNRVSAGDAATGLAILLVYPIVAAIGIIGG